MNLTIDTLILVTVWEPPVIFQGLWTIKSLKNPKPPRHLIYQATCDHCDQTAFTDNHIVPTDLTITECFTVTPSDSYHTKLENADALYLLQYALLETIKLLLITPKKTVSCDEQALTSIAQQYIPLLLSDPDTHHTTLDEFGFATTIDFNPTDPSAKAAAKTLLRQEPLHFQIQSRAGKNFSYKSASGVPGSGCQL